MKLRTDINDKPFLIDGETTLTITFEVGDIFIDANNKVKGIENMEGGKIKFVDWDLNNSFENLPLRKDFFKQYRYAGTIEDDVLPIYEDALSLCDEIQTIN